MIESFQIPYIFTDVLSTCSIICWEGELNLWPQLWFCLFLLASLLVFASPILNLCFRCINVRITTFSWWIDPFNYEITFFPGHIICSNIKIVIPAFFLLVLSYYVFVYHFTFNLFVSLHWKCLCRQHIAGTCLFIQPDKLCLLIVVFRQFTFNVIIDILGLNQSCYFFYLFHLFCVTFSFFFSSFFWINWIFLWFHLSLCWLISYNYFVTLMVALGLIKWVTNLSQFTFK